MLGVLVGAEDGQRVAVGGAPRGNGIGGVGRAIMMVRKE